MSEQGKVRKNSGGGRGKVAQDPRQSGARPIEPSGCWFPPKLMIDGIAFLKLQMGKILW